MLDLGLARTWVGAKAGADAGARSEGKLDLGLLRAVEFTVSLSSSSPHPLMPHLLGELAKTPKGCELLSAQAVVNQLVETVEDSSIPASRNPQVENSKQ